MECGAEYKHLGRDARRISTRTIRLGHPHQGPRRSWCGSSRRDRPNPTRARRRTASRESSTGARRSARTPRAATSCRTTARAGRRAAGSRTSPCPGRSGSSSPRCPPGPPGRTRGPSSRPRSARARRAGCSCSGRAARSGARSGSAGRTTTTDQKSLAGTPAGQGQPIGRGAVEVLAVPVPLA